MNSIEEAKKEICHALIDKFDNRFHRNANTIENMFKNRLFLNLEMNGLKAYDVRDNKCMP